MTDTPESTTPFRRAGLSGLRESHAPEGLKLHNLRRPDAAPTPLPAAADVSGGIIDWGMLGNGPDPANPPWAPGGMGNCGFAAWEHLRMAKAAIATPNGAPTFEPGFRVPHTLYTLEQYVAYGLAQGEPGPYPDQGVSNLSMLTWLYQQTKLHPGEDLLAFAEVALPGTSAQDNADAIHRAMIDFRGCLVGLILTKQAFGQFDRGEPWSISAANPLDYQEAHDVALVAYGDRPTRVPPYIKEPIAPTVNDWVITWGDWQSMTAAYDAAGITDVWVVMTREDADRAGYDFNAAIAEIETMLNAHS